VSTKTTIAWTDTTWNPVTGCTKVSEGCRNCYALAIAERFWGKRKFTDVRTHPDRLDAPLRWKKPRRVFVNSMSDLFHDAVQDEFIEAVFGIMAMASQHTFQVLTKRPERMLRWFTTLGGLETREQCVQREAERRAGVILDSRGSQRELYVPSCRLTDEDLSKRRAWPKWPLPNVWLGVSCEDQETANDRIPVLLQTPAAVRFLSCEPLLGTINLGWLRVDEGNVDCLAGWRSDDFESCGVPRTATAAIDWVIVGGESGRGHRPMQLDWARDLREQCRAAGVPFFFKQNSGPRPGQGEDALGEVVQEFPGGDSGTATAGGRGG